MVVKGWQKAAVVAGMSVGSIVGVGFASMAAADASVVQAQVVRPAQDLPTGYYIQGNTLYNFNKQPVALPKGWSIKKGVIYDPKGVEAKVVLKSTKTTTTSPVPAANAQKAECKNLHNKGGLDGMINNIVASALCLGDKVTKDSLHFAATATDAVVGPNGLLMLG
jgi:hypothetical protein